MTTHTVLSVPEIHCGHCKTSIEGAVGDVEGVATVEVDIEAAQVDVSFDDRTNLGSIVAAIEDVGYEVPAQG